MQNVSIPRIIQHQTPVFSHTFTGNFAVCIYPPTKMAPKTVERSIIGKATEKSLQCVMAPTCPKGKLENLSYLHPSITFRAIKRDFEEGEI